MGDAERRYHMGKLEVFTPPTKSVGADDRPVSTVPRMGVKPAKSDEDSESFGKSRRPFPAREPAKRFHVSGLRGA